MANLGTISGNQCVLYVVSIFSAGILSDRINASVSAITKGAAFYRLSLRMRFIPVFVDQNIMQHVHALPFHTIILRIGCISTTKN